MELAEPIEYINEQLTQHFGIDTVTSQPIWRVVWANDETCMLNQLHVDYDLSGNFIRAIKESRLIKKYPFYKDRYVLEQLVLVPEINEEQMCGAKISYESLWTFEDKSKNYLPPRLDVCILVVDAVHRAKGKPRAIHLLKDEYRALKDDPNGLRAKSDRVNKIKEELFGNESNITDNVAAGQGTFLSGNHPRRK